MAAASCVAPRTQTIAKDLARWRIQDQDGNLPEDTMVNHEASGPEFKARALVTALTALLVSPILLRAETMSDAAKKRGDRFTMSYRLEDCTFVTSDDESPGNPFFPLVPGQQLVLEGGEDDLHLEITTCLDDGSNCSTNDGAPVPGLYTVALDGIETRVIEEREWEDGELVEISHNFFARCEENGSVFYLGEKVEDIEDGEVVGGGGAWEAGVGNAMPGVIMPGIYLLGSRYFQEVAPGVALDRGEHTRMNLELEFDLLGVGETEFEGCVEVIETSPLDRKNAQSIKMYCPDVGLVFDDDAELVDKNF
jgi:hypothetical protein